jgi:hypothetical protein
MFIKTMHAVKNGRRFQSPEGLLWFNSVSLHITTKTSAALAKIDPPHHHYDP